MDRREFLRLTGVSLLATACTPEPSTAEPTCVDVVGAPNDAAVRTAFAAQAVAVDDAVFPQGIAAGSATATAVTFWGRIVGEQSAEPLRLRVWRDVAGDDANIDLVHDVEVTGVNDVEDGIEAEAASAIVKQRLEGLAPGMRYRYALFVGNDVDGFTLRSPIGTVRTAIPDDLCQPVVFAATTCTNPRNMPYKALEEMAAEDDVGPLDALLHVGDLVYADNSRTPTAYRGHYRAAFADPGYRALLQQTGMYLAWDDHEFDNNINPEQMPASLIEMAKDAFYENTPIERGADGAWMSWRWGTAVEVIQLDTRTERKPSLREADSAAYLSAEQMAFFKDRLKNSPCHFKVVMNSVPMTKMPPLWSQQGDRWQGYNPAREEILNFLEDNTIDNVWFISGDFHVGFVARVEPTGFRSRLFEVAVGPGGNFGNPAMAFVLAGQGEDVFPSEQFLHSDGQMAATRLKFDPGTDSVRIKFTAIGGEVTWDQTISRRT
jgi:phosphodiesterase/alkaline phosphatase D-like protein